jgi:hypothetical protein
MRFQHIISLLRSRVAVAMAILVRYCGSGSKLRSVVVRLPTVVSSADREK